MTTEVVDHEAALRMIHSGKPLAGRPAWGSWVLYGLGALRQDLPAYVVLGDPGRMPVDGVNNWSAGFLPAADFHSLGPRPGPPRPGPGASAPAAPCTQLWRSCARACTP